MWLELYKEYNQSNQNNIILIGNKQDLLDKREVSTEEINRFIDDHNIKYYFETSAKTGLNVKEIFVKAAEILLENNEVEKLNEEKNKDKEISSNQENKDKQEKDLEEKNEGNNITIKESKCSREDHVNNQAISYCQKCEVYLCEECDTFHSKLLAKHKGYINTINNNVKNNIFTGLCQENNHSKPLEYFCEDHNKLCCSECIRKEELIFEGFHKDCNICPLKEIKNMKKDKIKECYESLENISKTIKPSIEQFKKLYKSKNDIAEKLRDEIKDVFEKIRFSLNKRENDIISILNKKCKNIVLNEDYIKEVDLLHKEITNSLENIQSIEKDWEDDEKLKILINKCILIENSTKKIMKMEEEIKKFNEIHNLIIKFEPNYEGEFEDLIDKSKKIGNIYSEENEGKDEKEKEVKEEDKKKEDINN